MKRETRREILFVVVAMAVLGVFAVLVRYGAWWAPWAALIVFGALAVVAPRSGGPMDDVSPPLGIVAAFLGLVALIYHFVT